MDLSSIESPLGIRTFLLDSRSEVTVIFGAPQPLSPTEPEFFCPYQILGLGNDSIRYAIGMDALQAIEYTMQHVGINLYASKEARSGRLSWEFGRRKGDLGFPVTPGQEDLLP